MDAYLDTLHGTVKDLGDGVIAEVLVSREDENLSFLHRETRKGFPKEFMILSLFQKFVCLRFRTGKVFTLLDVSPALGPFPDMVMVRVSGKAIHPCRKIPFAPECMPVLQDPQKYLLDEVLAYLTLVGHPEVEIIELRMVSVKKVRKLADFAISHFDHEFDVRHRGHPAGPGWWLLSSKLRF